MTPELSSISSKLVADGLDLAKLVGDGLDLGEARRGRADIHLP
jgi:hypothetical protein